VDIQYHDIVTIAGYTIITGLVATISLSFVLQVITGQIFVVFMIILNVLLAPVYFPALIIVRFHNVVYPNLGSDFESSDDREESDPDDTDATVDDPENEETDGADESQYGADFDA